MRSLYLALIFLLGVAQRVQPKTYTVCTNPYPPLTICGPGKAARGLDILEFNRIAHAMGWVLDTNGTGSDPTKVYYRYLCWDLDQILEDLQKDDGECDIETSLGVTTDRVLRGYTYSYPIGRSKLYLMGTGHPHSTGWGFLTPFTAFVWVAVFVTTLLLVPFFAFLCETVHKHGTLAVPWSTACIQFRRSVWASIGTVIPLNNRDHVWRSLGARLVLSGYGILVLIMSNIFVAKLTAHTAAKALKLEATSPMELAGRNVGTLEIFHGSLNGYDMQVNAVNASGVTVDHVLQTLSDQTVMGWIMEEPWVAAVMNRFSCKYRLHSYEMDVHPYDHALVFGKRTSEALRQQVNQAIISLTERGSLVKIYKEALGGGPKTCFMERQGDGESHSTTMTEVWGVWVIVSVFILVGCLAALWKWSWSREPQPSDEEMMALELAELDLIAESGQVYNGSLRERFERLKQQVRSVARNPKLVV